MREQPRNNIARQSIKVWRIMGIIYTMIYWIIAIGIFLTSYFLFEWSVVYVTTSLVLGLLFTYLFTFLIPKLRYRRWRYEIFEQEIYIQHGVLIVTRTIIPMLRVQHVDTKQGPLLKKYKLATVSISTAATTHEIPALNEVDASNLRDRISQLARVDEDDL